MKDRFYTLSLSILTAIFQVNLGQPVFIEAKDDGSGGDNWTTGAISRTKLQSNHHHQQTNIQFFYRPDALPVTQPTLITTKCICNFIIYGVAKLVVFVTGWLFVMSQQPTTLWFTTKNVSMLYEGAENDKTMSNTILMEWVSE